jgi:hypothetical protein
LVVHLDDRTRRAHGVHPGTSHHIIVVGLLAGVSTSAGAQSPFLFATQPPNPAVRVTTSADAGYNAQAFEPVAGERLEPRATLVAMLSPLLSVQGQLAVASTLDHRTRLSEQMELMVTPVRAGAIALASSVGFRHEYSGAKVGLARMVAARTTRGSAFAADVLLEHAFAPGRDAVDVITTVGATRALSRRVWLGVEAVGSDLEGLVESDEAEGGATVLIGPTVAVGVSDRWRLLLGGGAVIRATSSAPINQVGPSFGVANGQGGYVLRASVRRAW